MRKLTEYAFHTGKLTAPVKLAVVSDLHNEPYEDIWPLIEGADALLVPGDVANRYRKEYALGIEFLREAAKRLPTFFSVGNHELRQPDFPAFVREAETTGAEILINRYVPFGEMWIGGWYPSKYVKAPDMMDDFEQLPGCRVLMCHKPNHYAEFLMDKSVDLVISGHAHGGQIVIGTQGLYAPGQGIFPKYTRGLYHDRMIVSAGAGNPCRMPRWNNPCEVLLITLT